MLTTQINCMTALVLNHAVAVKNSVVYCSLVRLALVAGVFPDVKLVPYLLIVLVRMTKILVIQLVSITKRY